MKQIILSLILLSWFSGLTQNMKEGFNHLEAGDFSGAEVFFQNVLQSYPQDRTARLCYARAVGLNGRPDTATSMFTNLLEEFPGDMEIELNYAESLLWNKDFSNAREFYSTLLDQYGSEFTLILGYANTLSNLKEYDSALKYIEQAIELNPGNPNAINSRLYIRLGKSAQLRDSLEYNKALALLQLNLDEEPDHTDTLLSMATIYLLMENWENAENIYKSITDPVLSLMGRSLIAHKKQKNKDALELARKARQLSIQTKDSSMTLKAEERFVQALLWNSKYSKARSAIAEISSSYGEHPTVLALQASYGMYSGKQALSELYYEKLLARDSTSFDGNLGMANVQKALGNLRAARKYAENTLTFYPNQRDALALLKSIDQYMSPATDTYSFYSKDNGNNQATGFMSNFEIPISYNTRAAVRFGYRNTLNTVQQQSASTTELGFGLQQRIVQNTWVKGDIGILKANLPDQSYSDAIGTISVSSPLLPRQNLTIGYNRALQNFNAALIDERIFMNNYSLNHNIGSSFGLGWYTGYTYTSQTDGNRRDLLFTSLYQNIVNKTGMLLKGGINYQYMQFEQQVPQLYFSPDTYQVAELFFDARVENDHWNFNFNAAGGYQYIEDLSATSAFRLEGSGGYRFNPRFQINLVGKYSTIASETATGFTSMEFGFKLRWLFHQGSLLGLD